MDVLELVKCLTVRLSTDIHSSLCVSITALPLLRLKILDLLSQICPHDSKIQIAVILLREEI